MVGDSAGDDRVVVLPGDKQRQGSICLITLDYKVFAHLMFSLERMIAPASLGSHQAVYKRLMRVEFVKMESVMELNLMVTLPPYAKV